MQYVKKSYFSLKARNLFYCFLLSVLAIMIIIMPSTVSQSIAASVDGCLRLLLPSVFPMMIISRQLSVCLSSAFGFSPKAIVLLIGLLCGYPTPAIIVKDLFDSKRLSSKEAELLCGLSNGASPAFLIFCVGRSVYNSTLCGFLLYLSQAIATACIAFFIKINASARCNLSAISLNDSIKKGMRAFAEICGIVIFYGLLADVLTSGVIKLGVNKSLAGLLFCFAEATRGIGLLSCLSGFIRELLLCLLCSLGGISVVMQIAAVAARRFSIIPFVKLRIVIGLVCYIIFSIFLKIFTPFCLQ